MMSGLPVIEGFDGLRFTAEAAGRFTASEALTRFTYFEANGAFEGFDGVTFFIDSGPTGDDFHLVLKFDDIIFESFVPANGDVFQFGYAVPDDLSDELSYFSDLFDDTVDGGGSSGDPFSYGSSGFSFENLGSGSYTSYSQLSLYIPPSIPGGKDDVQLA